MSVGGRRADRTGQLGTGIITHVYARE